MYLIASLNTVWNLKINWIDNNLDKFNWWKCRLCSFELCLKVGKDFLSRDKHSDCKALIYTLKKFSSRNSNAHQIVPGKAVLISPILSGPKVCSQMPFSEQNQSCAICLPYSLSPSFSLWSHILPVLSALLIDCVPWNVSLTVIFLTQGTKPCIGAGTVSCLDDGTGLLSNFLLPFSGAQKSPWSSLSWEVVEESPPSSLFWETPRST